MRNHLNRAILIASVGILLGLSSQAQGAENNGVISNGVDRVKLNEIHNQTAVSAGPAVKPFSLIDLSKLKWSQSYSMTFGSSAFGSAGVGLYSGSLLYEFSPKLSMQFSMGLAHNLSGGAVNSGGELFPAFSLDYHPSEKFRLRINVQKSPYSQGYLNPYNGFGGYGNGSVGGYGFGGYGFGGYPY